ncbi:unnamed protein product [Pedinophyceae sp. YPF-701]|nr:unnamed protein product [Pedinophyceae sp. YPF-701]
MGKRRQRRSAELAKEQGGAERASGAAARHRGEAGGGPGVVAEGGSEGTPSRTASGDVQAAIAAGAPKSSEDATGRVRAEVGRAGAAPRDPGEDDDPASPTAGGDGPLYMLRVEVQHREQCGDIAQLLSGSGAADPAGDPTEAEQQHPSPHRAEPRPSREHAGDAESPAPAQRPSQQELAARASANVSAGDSSSDVEIELDPQLGLTARRALMMVGQDPSGFTVHPAFAASPQDTSCAHDAWVEAFCAAEAYPPPPPPPTKTKSADFKAKLPTDASSTREPSTRGAEAAAPGAERDAGTPAARQHRRRTGRQKRHSVDDAALTCAEVQPASQSYIEALRRAVENDRKDAARSAAAASPHAGRAARSAAADERRDAAGVSRARPAPLSVNGDVRAQPGGHSRAAGFKSGGASPRRHSKAGPSSSAASPRRARRSLPLGNDHAESDDGADAPWGLKDLREQLGGGARLEDVVDDEAGVLGVVSGNPSVERICGRVHLYRDTTAPLKAGPTDEPSKVLPRRRGVDICCLSVPADMPLLEFAQFLGGYLPMVRTLRIVERPSHVSGSSGVYLVLMRFNSQRNADEFFKAFQGRPYNSFEPEVVCRLGFVQAVDFLDGSAVDLLPPQGATELPSCPVCLDRLDQHISGVVITACNHSFHSECLLKWGDTSCPVCRYAQQAPPSSSCMTCDCTSNLWVCLICAHVGCGRYAAGHAADHFRESGHCYSMELETHYVWDYVGDAFVHRLATLQDKGMLMEVPLPDDGGADDACGEDETCFPDVTCRPSGKASGAGGLKRGAVGGHDDASVTGKVRDIALEYEHLMVSQLDSQRVYFETMLSQERAAHAVRERDLEDERSEAEARAAVLQSRLDDFERRLRDSERRFREADAQREALAKERDFLQELNNSLLRNQKGWQAKVEAAEERARAEGKRAEELNDTVRDLMVYLEAQQVVSGESELQGGDVGVVAQAGRRGGRGRGLRGRRGR